MEKNHNGGAGHLASPTYVWATYATHLKGALAIDERGDRVMPLRHGKSQTWFKAEIEELADVQSYKVKTEDGRIRLQKPQTSLQE